VCADSRLPLQLGHFDGAIKQCRAVLAADAEHLQARLTLGHAVLESRNLHGDDAEAVVQLTKVVQLPIGPGSRGGPGLTEALREMALRELLMALSRRRQAAQAAADIQAVRNVEAQLSSLIDQYPDAVRGCTARY